MSSQSRKRPRNTTRSRKSSILDNLKYGRSLNPNHQKDDSSSEEIKSKKGKGGNVNDDEMGKIVDQLGDEMAKAMVELRMSTTEQYDRLEDKLDQTEMKLQDAKNKVREIRAKYEAAVKREKRAKNKISISLNSAPMSIPVPLNKPFSKCDAKEKEERAEMCVQKINEILGMDIGHSDFIKCRERLIKDVLARLQMKTRLSVEEDLQFAIVFSIPDHSREAMKKFFIDRLSFDIFATTAAVRYSRKNLCNTEAWKYVDFPDQTGASDGKKGRQDAYSFYDPNIETSLKSSVQALVTSSKLNLGSPYNNVIAFVIQLDKGGSLTKIGVSISNVVEKVGSPSNFTLLGITSLAEDYSKMKLAFCDVFKQLDKLNGTVIKIKKNGCDIDLKIRMKLGGDFKGGASSKHHCPICEGTKTVMKSWDVNCHHPHRSGYVLGEKNISKEPLIPSLTSIDIVVPVNHVLTGMTKKGMGLLSKLLCGEATEWDDEKEDRLAELTQSISVTAEAISSVRKLKAQIKQVHDATRQLANSGNASADRCNQVCLFGVISDSSLIWDSIPCSTCEKLNHGVCARSWNEDMLSTAQGEPFRCIDCRGETKATLMILDMDNISSLEESESEMMDLVGVEEGERNDLIRESGRTSEKLASALEDLKIQCGVYNRFYYSDLVGMDARRLTLHENAIKLWDLIEDDKMRSLGVQLFDVIHNLFTILHANYQTPEEMDKFDDYIKNLQLLWSQLNPAETVPLKVHSLTHMSETMRREGHAGREIELIEHAHHVLNVLFPRYLTITPLRRRLAIIVNRFNSKRYLLL